MLEVYEYDIINSIEKMDELITQYLVHRKMNFGYVYI